MIVPSKSKQKNPTPQQIAIYAAAIISVSVTSLVCMLVFQQLLEPKTWYLPLTLWLLIFLISYLVIVEYLKRYIYRKIKLIYKTIHKYKLKQESASNIEAQKDIISEVEKEVSNWVVEHTREIDDLKELEKYRRNFVGNISHELKTPIFNIQGFIHTLLDGGLEDPTINKQYLQRAAKNVERLQTIVEDLETISRLESGQMFIEMQVFDIRKLMEEVFEDLEIKAKEKNIKLSYKEGANKNYKVRADREAIRQVLMNLVGNSIKYGRNDGQTKVGFYDMDNYILVEVADNGIGIAEKHLNHVFDRFYRVDKSRSRDEGGSGLGLAIVKHIIEAHKQAVNVRSTLHVGSTFGITLEKV